MSGDLLSGRYPLINPSSALFGGMSNVVQSNLPARSNAEPGFGFGNVTDGALAATGIAAIVPCPIDPGTEISKIGIQVGATAGATLTHGFAALYAGTGTAPVLIGQSTDIGTTAAITASGLYQFSLTSAQLITGGPGGNAPNGFVYVAIVFVQSAGTIPTVAVMATPTGINYQWGSGTTAPLFQSATSGSGLTTTAANPLGTLTAKAVAPIVVLT